MSPALSRAALVVVACASLVGMMSFGIRSTFGLFLQPMSVDLGWGREAFALAMAIQNLLLGAAAPFAGALADKWGTGRTVAGASLLYGFGLYLMSTTTTAPELYVSTGVLIGLGLSGTSFGLAFAAVGRAVPEARRSAALGLTAAIGSLGQFLFPPIGQALLSTYGWSLALMLLAIGCISMAVAAVGLRGRAEPTSPEDRQTLSEALHEAGGHRGFLLLVAGFFVCGWHVAFIGIHLPSYLVDGGLPASIAAWCLATIGLFNVVGSYVSGVLGGRFSKKGCLSVLYAARAVLIFGFVMLPLTAASALIFSAIMGLLWLSTVPLTSALVAQIFGPRYMATLIGVVFFSHQVGAFLGVWLGGHLYDLYGNYDVIWWLSIALGLIAALLHWPIDERTVARLRLQS
jgi:MFS family permease